MSERKRRGCDGCKRAIEATYRLDNFGHSTIRIWLCQACLDRLQTWPDDQQKKEQP